MEQTQLIQTLNILVQAAEMGQSKGAFALGDAGVISQAVAYANGVIEEARKSKETSDAPQMEVVEEEPTKTKK
jgi:hypothetical protein